MTPHIVNRWVDTLILNIKGKMPEDVADELQQYQDIARDKETDILTAWEFAGCPLTIKPHGSGHGWRWLLFSDDIHLALGMGKFNGTVCKVTVRSIYLHSHDIATMLGSIYRFLVDFLGYEPDWQVSEVHQCADIAGWELTSDDADCFVSRGAVSDIPEEEVSRFPETQRRGRRVKAFYFSKTAPHSCCIYDKAREVKVHHKEWFYEVWQKNGWDGQSSVVRVEFRYERECLHEMGIEDPYQLIDAFDSMWAYSSQKWLRHTVPSSDSNQSRWATSDVWQVVQQASIFTADATPSSRVKKVELDTIRSLAGFVGYATSWAARLVLHGKLAETAKAEGLEVGEHNGLPLEAMEQDGGGFLAWAFDPMQAYLEERKQDTFFGVVVDKLKVLGQPSLAA